MAKRKSTARLSKPLSRKLDMQAARLERLESEQKIKDEHKGMVLRWVRAQEPSKEFALPEEISKSIDRLMRAKLPQEVEVGTKDYKELLSVHGSSYARDDIGKSIDQIGRSFEKLKSVNDKAVKAATKRNPIRAKQLAAKLDMISRDLSKNSDEKKRLELRIARREKRLEEILETRRLERNARRRAAYKAKRLHEKRIATAKDRTDLLKALSAPSRRVKRSR